MAPYHVLVVARWYPSWDDPGRGSFVADQVSALVAAGHRVTVASFDPTRVRGPEATRPERARPAAGVLGPVLGTEAALRVPTGWGAGVPVARLPVLLDGARRRTSDVVEAHARSFLPFGRALALRDPFDVIHAHTGLPDGMVAARLAEELALGLVVTEHSRTASDELVDRESAALYGRLVGPRSRLVAVSRYLAEELAERISVPADALVVLPNAIPFAGFPLGDDAAREKGELLYVGSRKTSKRIEALLRAFALARAQRRSLRLRLVGPPGTPEEEAEWARLIEALGIRAAVSMEGPADRKAVAAAMRRATLFVHPNTNETFGIVAAEAIASGLPAVVPPFGSLPEIVADRSLGRVAASETPEALAAAVLGALKDRATFDPPAMRERMVEAYAAERVATRVGRLYDEVVAATPRGRRSATPGTDARRGSGRAPAARAGKGHRTTTHGAAAASAAGVSSWRPPLVLGLVHEFAVSRVAPLPAELLAALTVVTLPPAANAADGPAGGRWRVVDPDGEYLAELAALGGPLPASRLARLRERLAAPGRDRERRALIARRAEVKRDRLTTALRTAWAEAGSPRYVLALDADDLLALQPLLGPDIAPAPGGLRWLVDGWDEAGRPGPA